jgi:hypothetical protein
MIRSKFFELVGKLNEGFGCQFASYKVYGYDILSEFGEITKTTPHNEACTQRCQSPDWRGELHNFAF